MVTYCTQRHQSHLAPAKPLITCAFGLLDMKSAAPFGGLRAGQADFGSGIMAASTVLQDRPSVGKMGEIIVCSRPGLIGRHGWKGLDLAVQCVASRSCLLGSG